MVEVNLISPSSAISGSGTLDKWSRFCRSSPYSISTKHYQTISKCYHSAPILRHRSSVCILRRHLTPAPRLGVQSVEAVEVLSAIIPSEREEVVMEWCTGCNICSRRWGVSLHLSLFPQPRVRVEDLYDGAQVLPAPLGEVLRPSSMHY